MYQGITEAYLLDPLVNSFIKQKNPHALRDIAERLLEAQQRGLWESVTSQTLEQLKEIIIQAEEIIEEVIP
jgi:cobaltochelatase CobN